VERAYERWAAGCCVGRQLMILSPGVGRGIGGISRGRAGYGQRGATSREARRRAGRWLEALSLRRADCC
jgi:hypothetical protein